MDIFVDYDNIDQSIRRLGAEHVVRKIGAVLEDFVDSSISRFDFRLYGGWYEGSSLTRNAQLRESVRRALDSLPRHDAVPSELTERAVIPGIPGARKII